MKNIYRTKLITTALTLLMLFVGNDLAAQTGYVNGIVRNPNGEPIGDALVVAFSAQWQRQEETTTNNAGRFSFLGLQPGQWLFVVQRSGYNPTQGFTPVRASGLGPRVTLTMEFDPLYAPTPSTGILANVAADDLHVLIDAANELFDLGDFDRAIDAYEAVLERAPPLTSLHLQIGHAYRKMQDIERALEAYRAVPASEPASVEARAAIEEIEAKSREE